MTSNCAMLNHLRPTLVGAFLAVVACASAMASQPTLDLSRYRGKVVVVDFWASWCKPCRESIPWLNQMRARHGARGLVVVGVNVDAERADADRFLRDIPAEFEVIYDPNGMLATEFGLKGMPSTFVYDRNGKLVSTYYGFREKQRAHHEAEIESLVSSSTN
jgi:cytochrome c biogenesis protein CcmG, thiol:disulfide interchange protein DsbE